LTSCRLLAGFWDSMSSRQVRVTPHMHCISQLVFQNVPGEIQPESTVVAHHEPPHR
jgi:hypothetical protein